MKWFFHIAIGLLLLGCDPTSPPAYKEQYVVEAYLIANEPMPQVILTRTVSVEKDFNFSAIGIRDAEIQVRLLNSDKTTAHRYRYIHSENGRYQPTDTATVRPKQWYKLVVRLPNGHKITAETFVPGAFEIADLPKERYVYQDESQITIITTPSHYPRRPTYYLFTVEALNNTEDNLTPFYKNLLENERAWIDSYYINSSEITSERNYNVDTEGNLIIKVPWSTIAFYGQNDISINAIDDNLFTFWPHRVHSILGISTTFSPEEIQQIPFNINGGIGIFGSLSRRTARVDILDIN